jgi:sugar lactone lactonase YvrE
MRFNDGRCDRQGRLRAGTMVMAMAQGLAVAHSTAYEGHGELRTSCPA